MLTDSLSALQYLAMIDNAVPSRIWRWVDRVLCPVTDDIGCEENGDYLLHYEGWGSLCVAPAWNPELSDGENEENALAYAEELSGDVISEWQREHRTTHRLVESGHVPNAAYG